MQQYLDVSRHQEHFDPAKARAAGVDGVFLRHAYGSTPDETALGWADACRDAGLTVAGYGFATWHYKRENGGSAARARTVMQRQVAAWIKAAARSGCTDWFAIDQELEHGQQMTLDKAQNTRLLNEAASLLQAAGLHPCVYCSVTWDRQYIRTADLTPPYWMARYYDGRADFGAPWADLSCLPDDRSTRWMRTLHAQGKLVGWQFASIGLGDKYGAASPGIDRSVMYQQPQPDALLYGRFGPGKPEDLDYLTFQLAFLAIPSNVIGETMATQIPVSKGDRATVQAEADRLGVPVQWQEKPFAWRLTLPGDGPSLKLTLTARRPGEKEETLRQLIVPLPVPQEVPYDA